MSSGGRNPEVALDCSNNVIISLIQLEILIAKLDTNMTGDSKLQNVILLADTIKIKCFHFFQRWQVCREEEFFAEPVGKDSLEKKDSVQC